MTDRRWYLLIHQIPARPLYLRAKIRKHLARAGAVALKKAVYVVPRREKLLRVLREIADGSTAGGGEAHLFTAEFLDASAEEALVESFRAERKRDYAALARRVREWTKRTQGNPAALEERGLRIRVSRAETRLAAIQATDFFEAPGRAEAAGALAALRARLDEAEPRPAARARAQWVGRTWVTRRGVQIDRIASAWLIRRFVDPKARFRFIDPHSDQARSDELGFDMAGGDFTHEDDRCTFETFLLRLGFRDPALRLVGEVVHDIDIKDGKFARPEARGVERLFHGRLATAQDDSARLHRGSELLDDLYESFRRLRAREEE